MLRCPVIPRVNDSQAHFDSILRLLDEFPQLVGAELLPYQPAGEDKSLCIGTCQPAFSCPSEEQCLRWEDYFLSRGYPQVKLAR